MSLGMCSLQKRPPKSRLARLACLACLARLDGLSRWGRGVGPEVARPSRPWGDRCQPEPRPGLAHPEVRRAKHWRVTDKKSENRRNEPTKCHPINNMTLDRTQIEATPKPLSGLERRTVLERTHANKSSAITEDRRKTARRRTPIEYDKIW